MKRLGIDLDGCIVAFIPAYVKLLAAEQPENTLPPDWLTSPSFPSVWDFEKPICGFKAETVSKVWQTDILAKPDFWQKLDILPGSYEAIRKLNWLARDGEAEVYFITHRMGNKAKLQSEKWLYDRGMDYPTVIISGPNKVPLLKALSVGFFIDDKDSTMLDLIITAERDKWLDGKQFYLKTAPYNTKASHPKLKRADTLEAAMKDAGLWRE